MLETKQNEKKKKGKHLPLTSTVSQNRWSCRKKSALDFQEEEVNPQAEQQHSPREVALPQGYKHPAKLVLKCTVSSLSIQGSPDSCLWLADLTPPWGLWYPTEGTLRHLSWKGSRGNTGQLLTYLLPKDSGITGFPLYQSMHTGRLDDTTTSPMLADRPSAALCHAQCINKEVWVLNSLLCTTREGQGWCWLNDLDNLQIRAQKLI